MELTAVGACVHMQNEGAGMALYESTFVARPDLTPKEVDDLSASFEKLVKDEFKGKVVKKEYWGIRQLAYPINKQKRGHYFFLGIDAEGNVVKEIERKTNISEDIMRNLTVSVKNISNDASAILRQSDDDDRPARREHR